MMIVVEPPENSTRFAPFQSVVASVETVLRLGPGDNYDVAALLPAGIVGEILPHSDATDGVLARGAYWWKVSFSETEGWVKEDDLRPVAGDPDWLWPDIWPMLMP
jgi:hypothetical protein